MSAHEMVDASGRKAAVLVVDANTPRTRHSGKLVVLENNMRYLSRRIPLHYMYLGRSGESREPHELIRAYVQTAQWVALDDGRESTLGRVRTWCAMQPWYYGRWRWPEAWERVREAIRSTCAARNISLIECFDYSIVQYALGLGVPVLNEHCDCVSLHLRRRAARMRWGWQRVLLGIEAARTARYEVQVVRASDASVFLSDVDGRVMTDQLGVRAGVHCIPNGVDVEYFHRSTEAEEAARPTVLFTGHMNYGPNVDAAGYLVKDVMPLVSASVPGAQLVLAGADPVPEVLQWHDGDAVVVTGELPDLRPMFGQAWVVACAVRVGAGIKNKVLEAMAMGKAIVATPVACDGIDVTAGEELRVASGTEEFAAAIVALLRDSRERRRLGENARARVERSYTWSSVGARRMALVEELIGRRSR